MVAVEVVREPPLMSCTMEKSTVWFFTRLLLASRTMAVSVACWVVVWVPSLGPMVALSTCRSRLAGVVATKLNAKLVDGELVAAGVPVPN